MQTAVFISLAVNLSICFAIFQKLFFKLEMWFFRTLKQPVPIGRATQIIPCVAMIGKRFIYAT